MQLTGSHRPFERRSLRSLGEMFWLVDLAAIVLFVFFLTLGAFGIGDIGWVAGLMAVLAIAWIWHAFTIRREPPTGRDPEVTRARERRGF